MESYRAFNFTLQKVLVKIHPSEIRDALRLAINVYSRHGMRHERGVKTKIVMTYVIMFCYSGVGSLITALNLIEKFFVVLIQSWRPRNMS